MAPPRTPRGPAWPNPDRCHAAEPTGGEAPAHEALKRRGFDTRGVNFGAGAGRWRGRRRVLAFANLRAFVYWNLRDLLDPEVGDDLALPPDPDLLAELAAARYEVRGGRVCIGPKADVAARLGRSPDLADAVAIACYSTPEAVRYHGMESAPVRRPRPFALRRF